MPCKWTCNVSRIRDNSRYGRLNILMPRLPHDRTR